ncbi:hypothetical protein IGB42_03782 [Andreprevotia sp. IGB-42]|uniref:YggT family protein n=1 Tax=Andreprevotia sp. IGB-42 TaxID=2497473 RepID=UPI00157E3CA7|nr:YggT family protein [Andreprevotia sp. IGB-42]KAF0811765.1 hypothetical protein IGB42_03782 [Andreprevotia sp. IGB-42]
MIANAMDFLIRSFAGFFILALLARFYMLALKAPFKNPLGQFIMALTNWMVLPTRRVLPAVRQYDSATFVVAWGWACSMYVLLLWLSPWPFAFGALQSVVAIALTGLLELLKMSLYLLFAAVIGQALLSWVAPYSPMMPLFNTLTTPFLRPLRRVIPPVGHVDITPMVLGIVIVVLNIFVAGGQQALLNGIPLPTLN